MTDPTPLTLAELEEAERFDAAADPGPWDHDSTVGDDIFLWSEKYRMDLLGRDNPKRRHNAATAALFRTLLPRALSSLKRAMDLLERATEQKCIWAGTGRVRHCEEASVCSSCSWNAERKRLLEGWRGK